MDGEGDVIQSMWPDGMRCNVKTCTKAHFQNTNSATAMVVSDSTHEYHVAEHTVTHNRVSICRRFSRGVLCSLFEHGSQICQGRTRNFMNADEDDSDDEEVVQRASCW